MNRIELLGKHVISGQAKTNGIDFKSAT